MLSERKVRALTGAVWVFVDLVPLSWDLSSQADLSFQQNSAANLGWFRQQRQLLGRLMGRLIELKLLRRVRTPDKYSITSRVPDKNLGFKKKAIKRIKMLMIKCLQNPTRTSCENPHSATSAQQTGNNFVDFPSTLPAFTRVYGAMLICWTLAEQLCDGRLASSRPVCGRQRRD